jgi:electron transfer flavoprotein alpha/beta subunit
MEVAVDASPFRPGGTGVGWCEPGRRLVSVGPVVRINQLRYATLKGMAWPREGYAVLVESKQKIVGLHAPEKGKKTQIIGGSPAEAAKELVRRLREEARVL